MSVYDLQRIDLPQSPSGFSDDTKDIHYVPAPCQVACPVGTDAPSYIGLIWEGKYPEAFEAITATNPFSSICGRVCDAPCEPACRRIDSDGPLQIRNLKRFVMDKVGHQYDPPPVSVTQKASVGIVGAGPAGLTAAHDLCVAGYTVHIYEMSDRLGGMMVWGIPAFRLPVGIIDEDIKRLTDKCEGLHIHLSTELGKDIHLDDLKEKHDAVLLTIGSWWGKPMGIPGEDHPKVIDGVGFLRRVNAGERPTLPKSVVVVGGGDVAMDACRVAKRLPDCKDVTVIYRRGPDEIPARKIELEGAVKEGIKFVYNTLQVRVVESGESLLLGCVKTEPGEFGEDSRRRPVEVPGTEHDIECGMVIAAVGQKGVCEELAGIGMMLPDRVRANWDSMRTEDEKVFAAGDGAFGGSTIVMAMHHGQRVAYYMKEFLEGNDNPMPYRTPYRTRRVEVAQDMMWERIKLQHPEFLGMGAKPIEFPEIEVTYDEDTAKKEAARCYRCDAETGTPDYSVQHREDLFSMARIGADENEKRKAILQKRLISRENPFPHERPPQFDDIVFLPANLSRLVIDPYREACRVDFDLGGRLSLAHPFIVTGFDAASEEVRRGVAQGIEEVQGLYLGSSRLSTRIEVPWLQVLSPSLTEADITAAGLVKPAGMDLLPGVFQRLKEDQLLGLSVSSPNSLHSAITQAVDTDLDLLILDGTGSHGVSFVDRWPELAGAPDLSLLRDAIAILRDLGCEEAIDLVWFGGVRSGTDAAKLVGLGAVAMVLGVSAGMAAGGQMEGDILSFSADLTASERAAAMANLITANTSEASMMARCTGKTDLHNIEPEDLRALTLATSESTGLPLAGKKETL